MPELPPLCEKPDFGPVLKLVKEQMVEVKRAVAEGMDPCEAGGDLDHYIYEAAMEAVYGPRVWDYINQNIDVDLDSLPQEGDLLIHAIEGGIDPLSACGVDTTSKEVLSDWDLAKVTCQKCLAKLVLS